MSTVSDFKLIVTISLKSLHIYHCVQTGLIWTIDSLGSSTPPQLIRFITLRHLLAHPCKLTPKEIWLYYIKAVNELVKLDDTHNDRFNGVRKRPIPLCLFCNNIMKIQGYKT